MKKATKEAAIRATPAKASVRGPPKIPMKKDDHARGAEERTDTSDCF